MTFWDKLVYLILSITILKQYVTAYLTRHLRDCYETSSDMLYGDIAMQGNSLRTVCQ